MNDIIYTLIPIIISCIVSYSFGKTDGFKDGFATAERVYHKYLKEDK